MQVVQLLLLCATTLSTNTNTFTAFSGLLSYLGNSFLCWPQWCIVLCTSPSFLSASQRFVETSHLWTFNAKLCFSNRSTWSKNHFTHKLFQRGVLLWHITTVFSTSHRGVRLRFLFLFRQTETFPQLGCQIPEGPRAPQQRSQLSGGERWDWDGEALFCIPCSDEILQEDQVGEGTQRAKQPKENRGDIS